MPKKIISGGQTGIDRGVLDACLFENFPTGGWCPKNRLAEDGKIDEKYPLQETGDNRYEIRTQLNVMDSDGTLIISPENKLSGGTLLTQKAAEKFNKPFLIITPEEGSDDYKNEEIRTWINRLAIQILNIAGPRQSEWRHANKTGYRMTEKLIQNQKI